MFFSIQHHEEAAFSAAQFKNPVTPGNPMILTFMRTYTNTAFFSATSKDTTAFYIDTVSNKRIAKKYWTNEMQAFAREKESKVPAAAYRFKVNFFGYVMLLFFVGFFAYLTYDSFVKPVNQEAIATRPLELPIEANDVYFGRFEQYKEGDRVPIKAGFGWFKILENTNGNLKVAMSKEMKTHHQDPKTMNAIDFEEQGTEMKIEEQVSYNIRLKSNDGLLEVNLTDKK